MTASELSELSVRQLLARRRRLTAGLSDPERTLRGVLLQKGRTCSSEGCRCRRGELHGPYSYLAIYTEGRSRTVYVPAVVEAATRQHVELTQRNVELLAEISQVIRDLHRLGSLRRCRVATIGGDADWGVANMLGAGLRV